MRGLVPVQEAIAMGKPVIAPDVGYCWNFPVIKYDGTLGGLISLLEKLVVPVNSWEISAKKIIDVCHMLMNQ